MKKTFIYSSLILFLVSCSKEKEKETFPFVGEIHPIPEFYSINKPGAEPDYTLIADETSVIINPQDLDFNPLKPEQLWVLNKGDINNGGNTVMITNPGKPSQKYDYKRDGNAWHFMQQPSALSFSDNGNWATAHDIQDANHRGGTFTGPTLWSSDLRVYAQYAGTGSNGSHLDMLHASPFGMGIESESANVFWMFDGYHGNIVRYDFVADHGPGNHDHSDGKVHRYSEIAVKREAGVPSHLVLDKKNNLLYIVDGGNKRVLKMNIKTGSKKQDLPEINEPLAEYWEMHGAEFSEFIPSYPGLKKPCGIEIIENRLFVSDYENGDIVCYNTLNGQELGRLRTQKPGIMGIKLGPDGHLYFVCSISNQVWRIDPQ